MHHTRAHFCRAVYEGIALSIRDLLQGTRAAGQRLERVKLIGGGARSAVWGQIVSDVTGLELEVPRHGDAAFGSALLAGVGVGLFGTALEAVERCAVIATRYAPQPAHHALYAELYAIYAEARCALTPLDHRLHRLFSQHHALP